MENYFVKSEHTVQVALKPSMLAKNYIDHIQEQLKSKFENKCHPKLGFIKKGSVKMLRKAQGIIIGSHFTGEVSFTVTFSCLSTRPVIGTTMICVVVKKNDIGLLALARGAFPYDILVPRDLEQNVQNRALIDSVNISDTIEVIVVDSKLNAGNKENPDARYYVIGQINKTNIANQKFSFINSIIPITSLVPSIVIADDSDKSWLSRTDYITAGEVTFSDLEKAKRDIEELNKQGPVLQNKLKFRPAPDGLWEYLKKYINDYEFVTSKSPLKPYVVSRAFYKMHEMIIEEGGRFELLKPRNMRILNLAESPGGFIQAIIYNRRYNVIGGGSNYADNYVAVSIPESDETLWGPIQSKSNKKTAPDQFKHIEFKQLSPDEPVVDSTVAGKATVHLCDGVNGDLTRVDTIDYIEQGLGFNTNKADLITADGGIGTAGKETLQEIVHYKLFFGEMLAALTAQAAGGSFVLKVYDIFTRFTVELVAFISSFYESTCFYKPITSRQANSEKYLVCTGFLGIRPSIIAALKEVLSKWPDHPNQPISVLNIIVPEDFLAHMRAYNADFLKIEWSNLNDGLVRGQELVALAKENKWVEIEQRVSARDIARTTASVDFLNSVLKIA